jgi:hypothetical protein
MRTTVVSSLVLAQLAWGALAFAQDTTTTGAATTPATGVTTTVTPTTTSVTTTTPAPVTGTVTTTQAAIDTSPAPFVPPPEPPESGGSETTSYINRPLLVTGLVFLGGTYIASAAVAGESSRPSDNPNLYYPVAGPWIDLAQRDCTAVRPCSGEPGNKALLILDGVGQGVGALGILTSFFVPEKKSRHWFFIGNEKVNVTPSTIGSGYGLTTMGTF